MISYYELLGMVKEGNAPERIEVSLTSGTPEIYKAEYDAGEFNYYLLDKSLQDDNYRFYLSECFLESSMFDKCIKILDDADEFEDIEEIGSDDTIDLDICESFELLEERVNQLIKNQKKIIEKLKKEGKEC